MSMVNRTGFSFKVIEAMQKDVGRGIIRIDPADLAELNLEVGSFVQITGSRPTTARVMPLYPEFRGKKVVQMDGITRENAKVTLGSMVNIAGTEVQPGQTIVLTPLGKVRGKEKLIGKLTEGICLGVGDKVRIFVLGLRSEDYEVQQTFPQGFVSIHSQTKIVLKGSKSSQPTASMLKYDDIGGLSNELAKVREIIELPLKYPELFERLGIEPPRGVLLTGPPGTGKTLIAKAVAGETECHFIHVNGPEIINKYYGESEAKLREIFDDASKYPQSIVFLDEIDAIAPKREDVNGEVEKRVVAQLLTLMDGLKERGRVIVIGATNLLNNLDDALRRPGRFDREISIGVPDRKGRLEILQIHTRGMPLTKDVDLNYLADITHGFVGADLQALAAEAAMSCLRRVLLSPESGVTPILEDKLCNINVQMADFDNALKGIEPSATKEFLIEIPKVTWNEVGGYEEVKKRLRQVVEWPLKHGDLYKKACIEPPKGVLLFGPPGTGKTLLAKAVANECSANFISIKGPALLSKWVGESEKAIGKLFKKARQAAPCIIFIDELDTIAPQRGCGDLVGERLVGQLLTEIDGIEELRGVVMMAATNRKDLIDPSLLRPGRFDIHLELNLPDEFTRLKIFEVLTKKMSLEKAMDWQELAILSAGFSGAEIRWVCQRAGLLAVEEALSLAPKGRQEIVIKKDYFQQALMEIKKH